METYNMDNNTSYKSVNVNEIDSLLGKVEVIDIREPYEFREGSLSTATNIPMGELINYPETFLEEGKTYYIICRAGIRSKNACSILKAQGYDVVDVTGGMMAYTGNQRQ